MTHHDLRPRSTRSTFAPAVPTPARRAALWSLALLATAVVASQARAHSQSFPIAGDRVRVQTNQGPGVAVFEFDSTDAEGIFVAHDPTSEGSAVLVRGVGGNAGRTPLLELDPGSWMSTGPSAFQYSDLTGSSGGITSVVFNEGELRIDGAGPDWPWAPSGDEMAVWVHFRVEDEWTCAEFGAGATIVHNEAGFFEATDAPAPGVCPEQVCGNGEREVGEECDDGNLDETDGCNNDCTLGECTNPSFDSTFEGIQNVVFEGYGCTFSGCHSGPTPQGDLDLTGANSYESLLGPDGNGAQSPNYLYERVQPGEPGLSLLYLKLLQAKTSENLGVGSGMPIGGALSDDHLEAVRKWIRGAAPEEGVVEGTAALLDTCLPEPTPLKAPVPEPPAPGTGFQLQQTPWPLRALPGEEGTTQKHCSSDLDQVCTQNSDCGGGGVCRLPQGEDEICMATLYDLTATELVPEWADTECPDFFQPVKGCSNDNARSCETDADCDGEGSCILVLNALNPDGRCVYWHRQVLTQDPQSHHSIIHIYRGQYDWDAPPPEDDPETPNVREDNPLLKWGPWTYHFEPDDPRSVDNGRPCDPTEVDPALGYHPGCSGQIVSAVGCTGYGPVDTSNFGVVAGATLPAFSGSQEPYFESEYVDGVYGLLPQRGIVVWNSHAFNLTDQDSTMAQYLDMAYAGPEDQRYPAQGIFNAEWIFAENVPAFETREICATHTLPVGARLFSLSSHTHLRGVRWRTWGPPNTPCQPRCPGYPGNDTCIFGAFCGCQNDLHCSDDPQAQCMTDGDCSAGNTCVPRIPFCDDLGYPREDEPLYFSTEYSDPLQLQIDPPLRFDSPDAQDRTLLFCSLFDNGSTPTSPPVKQQSTAPEIPPIGIPLPPGLLEPALGGPCRDAARQCLDGPKRGAVCGDQADPDGFCGAAGLCDACPVHGGVTTEDEMFILIGTYFVPEPSGRLLALVALTGGTLLARRRAPRRR